MARRVRTSLTLGHASQYTLEVTTNPDSGKIDLVCTTRNALAPQRAELHCISDMSLTREEMRRVVDHWTAFLDHTAPVQQETAND